MKRKGKSRTPVIQGERRITRLQSKLNSLPSHSSSRLIPRSKLNDEPCLPQDKHKFLSAKRFRKEGRATKAMQDPKEPEESQAHSSNSTSFSLPSSQFQAAIDHFSQPVSSAIAPPERSKYLVQRCYERSVERLKETLNFSKPGAETSLNNGNSEGCSQRNNCLELCPSRSVTAREVDAASFVETAAANVPNDFDQRPEDGENPTEHSIQTVHFGMTEIVRMCGDENLNADEAESPAVVLILGKYIVKEALVPTIKSIIEKHGDIAANCQMDSQVGRSLFLEHLAELVRKLETKTFAKLPEGEIEAAMELVSKFSEVGLDVGWLQQRLKDLLEARRMIEKYRPLKQERKKAVQVVEEMRQALMIAKARVVLCQQQVDAATEKLDAISNTIMSLVDNVRHHNDHTPLHGLL